MLGQSHTVDALVEEVAGLADEGFATAWFAQLPYRADALTLIATVGRHVEGITLGSSVVPIAPRHPAALAQQALTVQAATGGRLVMGLGLSHPVVMEDAYGLPYDHPARRMGEYLSIFLPLVQEGKADVDGEHWQARLEMAVPGGEPFPILLSALGPKMLRLAGSLTDGTITWMTGPVGLAGHIVPRLREAAGMAGRQPPRVVVGLPVCVTDDVSGARRRAAARYEVYGTLPAYRAMLDREGVAGPEDVALIGATDTVHDALDKLADCGATELLAVEFGNPEERAATRALLRSRL
jgi:5,10-methylenetetrahydromethanopterin reductase